MHRIGLAALSVLELTPPEMVSCASDAGFDSIGLRLIPATAEEVQHAMVGDTPLVRETRVESPTPACACSTSRSSGSSPTRESTTTGLPSKPAHASARREALVAGNDPDEARLTERFAAFCELAAQFGIAGNLEPMPWTDVRTFAARRAHRRSGGARAMPASSSTRSTSIVAAAGRKRSRPCLPSVCVTCNCATRRRSGRETCRRCFTRRARSG